MPNRGPFPTKDGDRNTYYNTAIAYIAVPANKARLGVSDDRVTSAQDLLTQWNTTYPLAKNPATSTKTLIQDKDGLINDIEDALREIYGDIPASVLTTTDRNTLNLKERDAITTPRPVINDAAFSKIKSNEGARMEFILRTDADATRASRHPDSDGAEIVYTIGTTAPASPADCNKTIFTSKAKGTFDLGVENAGKKVFGFVRWKNNSDNTKSGPWSQMFSAVISD